MNNLILLYPLPGFRSKSPVVAQFDCHPEQAFFAQRGIWASRAMRRALCDAIIARLARFLIELSHYPIA